MAIIEVQDLHKKFKNLHVLKGITTTIEQGSCDYWAIWKRQEYFFCAA